MRVCDPRLIKAVCDVEPWQSDEVLLATGVPRLIQQREEPDPYEQADQARSFQTAWQMLLQDFLTRVGRGEVFLEGVLIHPNPNTTPEPIPHVWAADIRLGVASGAAEVAGRRYVSVQVRFERPMPDTEHVSLFDALLRSADPSLLEAVRQAERRHLAHELQEFYRKSKGGRRQLIDDGEAQVPSSGSWTGGASLTPLSVAWIKLVAAFRATLEEVLEANIILHVRDIASAETAQQAADVME
ncbi:MAG: hypothetical protein M1823_006562, partial [Watsoniomyces obsoletus]